MDGVGDAAIQQGPARGIDDHAPRQRGQRNRLNHIAGVASLHQAEGRHAAHHACLQRHVLWGQQRRIRNVSRQQQSALKRLQHKTGTARRHHGCARRSGGGPQPRIHEITNRPPNIGQLRSRPQATVFRLHRQAPPRNNSTRTARRPPPAPGHQPTGRYRRNDKWTDLNQNTHRIKN